ncbi:hypothetical protein IJ118_01865, partial [Candidatus Saccharibacteria bacterium]|nr:hypothetical protein [Candidatus Saccharibacteria bacterium]
AYLWSSTNSATGNISYALNVSDYSGISTYVGSNSELWAGMMLPVRCLFDATMQNFTSEDADSLAEFESETLVDSRDGNTYTVKKINGNVWMTQNLRLLGNTGSPAGKMVLSSDTSNGASGTIDLYSLNSSNAGSFGAYANHCDSTNGYNYACVYDSGNDTTGVWYNYAAATANNIKTNSNQTAVSASGPSICPSGWHLPTGPFSTSGTDGYTIFQNTSYGSWIATNASLTAFNAVPGGFYRNGSLNGPESGFWWSATVVDATGRYDLGYNSSNTQFVSDGYYRYYGFFVRCVRTS